MFGASPKDPSAKGVIKIGAPRSDEFDDVYFSADDGLAETEHVFLDGNRLPRKWQEQDRFVICETGFGTGLNFLAAWTRFEETTKPHQKLDFISFEKYPLDAEEIGLHLRPWADHFTGRLSRLLALYPPRLPGFHRLQMNERVTLTLVFDDVQTGLPQLMLPEGVYVDAWFLDGFKPSTNPDMWSETVFTEMARLSDVGARMATFTAAGQVRRGLAEVGFDVEKVDGFGTKRDMTIGRFRGASSLEEAS